MTPVTLTKRVNGTPAAVFDVFSDIERLAERVSGIKKLELLTNGPVGMGTRFRETREMFGREAIEEMEITRFEHGSVYTLSCHSCGCIYEKTFHFVPDVDGTRVRVEMIMRPLGIFAKIMAPIGRLMMGKAMRKCIDQDLEDLKKAVETGPSVTTTPPPPGDVSAASV